MLINSAVEGTLAAGTYFWNAEFDEGFPLFRKALIIVIIFYAIYIPILFLPIMGVYKKSKCMLQISMVFVVIQILFMIGYVTWIFGFEGVEFSIYAVGIMCGVLVFVWFLLLLYGAIQEIIEDRIILYE